MPRRILLRASQRSTAIPRVPDGFRDKAASASVAGSPRGAVATLGCGSTGWAAGLESDGEADDTCGTNLPGCRDGLPRRGQRRMTGAYRGARRPCRSSCGNLNVDVGTSEDERKRVANELADL